jgi:hypothetical protein
VTRRKKSPSKKKQPKIESRTIPAPMRREIRQRCGFGCVLCGLPLYHYDHMEDWAKAHRHVASEITLLCAGHHDEKTRGLLPNELVRAANASPANLKAGASRAHSLRFSGGKATICLGNCTFGYKNLGRVGGLTAIAVDGTPLIEFRLQDGHLLLSLTAYDTSNTEILSIRDNQLIHSAVPWDIEFVGTTLTIRAAAREIVFEIEFSPPSEVRVSRARLLRNGVEILIGRRYIFIVNNGNYLSNFSTAELDVGLFLGNDPLGRNRHLLVGLENSDIPRYPTAEQREDAVQRLREIERRQFNEQHP